MRFVFGVLVALLLAGCSLPKMMAPPIDVTTRQFSEALRWGDIIGAASYMQDDVREEFYKLFKDNEDLHVLESEVITIAMKGETRTAEVDYRLKFYKLPSTRVKKWKWTQVWQLQSETASNPGVWLIENAPPALP